jgi:tetratricopeptide (TPR) repeat protein
MINKDNGFDLNIRWRFPGGREYAFAVVSLLAFLIVIYANSFQSSWQFDDTPNIVENKNIFLKSLDWPDIKKTFYGKEGEKIDRPLSYLSFALNYYFDELNVIGYHIVNFIIHSLASIFLFFFIYNTLKLPKVRDRYGNASYSIALLATIFWATSPLQVTAVTYIVQRMASMSGLFYLMAMYFYLKGRTDDSPGKQILFWGLCALFALFSCGTKENAVLLPVSIWLYDLLLIQGATRENIVKNLKIVVPVIFVALAIGLWYVDIYSILSGDAYKHRPFTLMERLLTQPRVIIFYITLLFYPLSSRLTLIHDIELSNSLLTPWSTFPSITLIIMLLCLAGYLCRKRPLISFCIFFFFLNHMVESTFIPLELIYEHRNYIPSMFFFVPIVIFMLSIIDYFAYKKAIQFTMAAVFAFLLFAQGHTVHERNALFAHPLLLWTDIVMKAPELSRPYNNLGRAYWKLGRYNEACNFYPVALSLDRWTNLTNRGVALHNLGACHYLSGEYDKALEYFEAAMTVYPGLWGPYYDAAQCFIRKGKMEIAKDRLVAALALWPHNAHLHYSLSFILLKQGEYENAIAKAQQVLALDANHQNALKILGEAARQKGNYRISIFYWERFLEKHPNDLEGNLALIQLYAKENKISDLTRTIGKVTTMKGSKRWPDLISQFLKDANERVYVPNAKDIGAIVRGHLVD